MSSAVSILPFHPLRHGFAVPPLPKGEVFYCSLFQRGQHALELVVHRAELRLRAVGGLQPRIRLLFPLSARKETILSLRTGLWNGVGTRPRTVLAMKK